MKATTKFLAVLLISALMASCAVVKQGEVGVKRTLGKYEDRTYTDGLRFYTPFVSNIVKIPTQTENLEVSLRLPSKEGLNIMADISILYNVISKEAPRLLRTVGKDYESNVILPVFRSAIADVSSRYFAKDMHTGERGEIELAIKNQMDALLEGKGLTIEAVLIKSIELPPNLARAIEEKLQAEQQALRMQFVLQEAQQEAERRKIEAQGVRDAQLIIAEGLSREILQFKSIEAFHKLANSPNTKIIISDGDLPLLMDPMNGETSSKPRTSSVSRLR